MLLKQKILSPLLKVLLLQTNYIFINGQKLRQNKYVKSRQFSNSVKADFLKYLDYFSDPSKNFDQKTGQLLDSSSPNPEIINNWVVRSIEKSIDNNAFLQCNPNSMCIRLSDEWLRSKMPDLYQDNPSILLSTLKNPYTGECGARPVYESVQDSVAIIKNGLGNSRNQLNPESRITHWEFCENLSNLRCGLGCCKSIKIHQIAPEISEVITMA